MSLDRTCEACGALPGKPCLTTTGRTANQPHGRRSWDGTRSPKQAARAREYGIAYHQRRRSA